MLSKVIGAMNGIGQFLLKPFRWNWVVLFDRTVLRSLFGYPFLTGQIVVMLLISWGFVGAELGLSSLYWHEYWWSQFLVGLGTGWLYGVAFYVGVLLFEPAWALVGTLPDEKAPENFPKPWPTFFPTADPSQLSLREVGRRLFWVCLSLLAVQYAGKWATVVFLDPNPDAKAEWAHRAWGLYFLAGYAGSMVCVMGLYFLDNLASPPLRVKLASNKNILLPGTPIHSGQPLQPQDWSKRLLHAVAINTSIATVVVFTVAIALSQMTKGWISPGVLFTLTLNLLTIVGGFVAFRVPAIRVLGLLIFAWLLGSSFTGDYRLSLPGLENHPHQEIGYTHRIENGQDLYQDQYRLNHFGKPTDFLIDSEAPLRQIKSDWQTKMQRPNEKPKLVLVATSGGGIRAAVWTGLVLEGLEKGVPNLRNHIRMFTGASGGMVGAAAYVGNFPNGPLPDGTDENQLGPLSSALAEDALTPVIQTMVLRDFTLTTLLPFPRRVQHDRGRTLEDTWRNNFLNSKSWNQTAPLDTQFQKLKPLELAGQCPSLVFSPVMVEDTKRLLITNLDFKDLARPSATRIDIPPEFGVITGAAAFTARQQTSPLALPFVEFHRLFPDAKDFTIGTAARVSASFPVVSPAVSLPTTPVRRVVDAGYLENYGVDLAALWLMKHHKAVLENTSGVLLIQIRAYPQQDSGLRFTQDDPGPFLRMMGAISAPAEAILTARGQGAYLRNNSMLDLVSDHYTQHRQPGFFNTVIFELNNQAALSWYLTSGEKKKMAEAFRQESPRIQAVERWFTSRP